MVQAGSIVDVQLTSSTGTSTADGVIAKAAHIISSGGQMVSVGPSIIGGGIFGAILNFVESLNYSQPFQVDFPVRTLCDFGNEQDVASIVANAFMQANSNEEYPTSVSAVSVQAPGSNVVNATGSPALDSSGVGGGNAAGQGTASSISDSVAAGMKKLGDLGTNLLIGLAAIIILTLVLIAYGPNIGKIASHA